MKNSEEFGGHACPKSCPRPPNSARTIAEHIAVPKVRRCRCFFGKPNYFKSIIGNGNLTDHQVSWNQDLSFMRKKHMVFNLKISNLNENRRQNDTLEFLKVVFVQ